MFSGKKPLVAVWLWSCAFELGPGVEWLLCHYLLCDLGNVTLPLRPFPLHKMRRLILTLPVTTG